MMLYPSMNELLERIPSRYLLVNVVARRAREIVSYSEDHDEPLDEKAVSIAIDEIHQGQLVIKSSVEF